MCVTITARQPTIFALIPTTSGGRAFRMLCIFDEFSRESLAIRVARKLKAPDVIEALCDLFVWRDVPSHIRSDNGPEFVALATRRWFWRSACFSAMGLMRSLSIRKSSHSKTSVSIADGIQSPWSTIAWWIFPWSSRATTFSGGLISKALSWLSAVVCAVEEECLRGERR